MKKSIIVIGGGIVGVAAALQLQLDGHQVRLIDRQQPGRETSYGNAGVLSDSSVVVLNNPGLIKALPKLLLNRSNGFVTVLFSCCGGSAGLCGFWRIAAHRMSNMPPMLCGRYCNYRWASTKNGSRPLVLIICFVMAAAGLNYSEPKKALPIMRLKWLSCAKSGSRFRSLIASRSGRSNPVLSQFTIRAC